MGDGWTQPQRETEQDGGETEQDGGETEGPSPGLFWKKRGDAVAARQLGGPGSVSPKLCPSGGAGVQLFSR